MRIIGETDIDYKQEDMSIEDMIEDLEQYYESAGFSDFYQRELKNKTPDEIRELYRTTFDENDA